MGNGPLPLAWMHVDSEDVDLHTHEKVNHHLDARLVLQPGETVFLVSAPYETLGTNAMIGSMSTGCPPMWAMITALVYSVMRPATCCGPVLCESGRQSAATIVITILPMLALYPFVQRYFIRGVMLGSVKG